MGLDNNNHSVFRLKYRLLFTTHKLKKIITKDISNRLQEIFANISERYNVFLYKWEEHKDYIDICFNAHPNTEISKFINAYKSAASRWIKKEYPELNNKLHNGQFWSKTFCLLTLDHGVDEDTIQKFLHKQG